MELQLPVLEVVVPEELVLDQDFLAALADLAVVVMVGHLQVVMELPELLVQVVVVEVVECIQVVSEEAELLVVLVSSSLLTRLHK